MARTCQNKLTNRRCDANANPACEPAAVEESFARAAHPLLAGAWQEQAALAHNNLHRCDVRIEVLFQLALAFLCSFSVWAEARAEKFSINDAISQAVLTNPGVGEASANRRATETELRQTQSTLLPQVRLEARAGPEKFTQDITPPPLGNGQWLNGKSGSVVVRQILFDGLASIDDIWRQAARVNAASFRVRERSELIALDAAESIDVVRFLRLSLSPIKTWPITRNCFRM